jgi:hypothetical protein
MEKKQECPSFITKNHEMIVCVCLHPRATVLLLVLPPPPPLAPFLRFDCCIMPFAFVFTFMFIGYAGTIAGTIIIIGMGCISEF